MTKQINPRCPFQLECERTKCEFVHSERDCGYYSSNVMPGSEIEDQTDCPDDHEDDYSVGTVRDIDTITGEILEAKRVGGEAIITIGQRLIEAKALLSHGEWLPWLAEQVEYSERTAQKFMKIAKEYSNPSAVADLGFRKALQLLALPESEREEFLSETHQVNGEEKTVIDMTSRELEKAIKERDEARKTAERAQADTRAAQEARRSMEESLKTANEMLGRAKEDQEAATSKAADLEKQLAELKAAPVDVAVMAVDQAQLDAARAEGEAHAEKEFKKARAEAQRQVSEANAATAAIKTELQQKQRELDNLQFELNRAKSSSSSPIALDAEVAQFKLLFEHTQGFINQMHGLLIKVRGREDQTAAESLARAIIALGEAAKEAAK